MAGARQTKARRFSTLGRLSMLAIPGFALGALAGLLWEDPGLVAAYVFGATEEVAWAQKVEGEGLPDVASAPAVGSEAAPAPVSEAPAPAASAVAVKAAKAPAATPPRTQPPAKAAAPKRETRVSPPIQTAAAGKVAIQVGAFAERAGAERLAQQLRGKGFPVLIVAGESSGSSRWRVRVGPLASRDEAEKTAVRIKRDEKLPTWIVEVDG